MTERIDTIRQQLEGLAFERQPPLPAWRPGVISRQWRRLNGPPKGAPSH